jgi:hypothetical protein
MKKIIYSFTAVLVIYILIQSCVPEEHPVYMGKKMSYGYDLGVTTDNKIIGWLSDSSGYMKMEYPAEQLWGAVFVTVGKIKDLPSKPTVDLTAYYSLSVELKGLNGNEKLQLGMKDSKDIDDGAESKVEVVLTKDWKEYIIPLDSFKTADLKNIYTLVEFVFNGKEPQTAYFRNIQFK